MTNILFNQYIRDKYAEAREDDKIVTVCGYLLTYFSHNYPSMSFS
jgi:hypothetical protein